MEARVSVIEKRLKSIKRVISVASGKGGVGKSLVASCLALDLAKKNYKVGLFDLDLYGPSSHIILGVKVNDFPEEKKGIIPPKVHGINFISIVYFTEDKPSPFRGIDISNIIIELLAITQWGPLDYLIIDMPPGIGDEILDIINLIKKSEFLVVTIPSKVALGAVSKLLVILKELKIPIIGVLENMTMTKSNLVKNEIFRLDLPYLGAISFDKTLEKSIGSPYKILKTNFINEFDEVIERFII
jgi:ATP-binding protein involved in chromosome partitioning